MKFWTQQDFNFIVFRCGHPFQQPVCSVATAGCCRAVFPMSSFFYISQFGSSRWFASFTSQLFKNCPFNNWMLENICILQPASGTKLAWLKEIQIIQIIDYIISVLPSLTLYVALIKTDLVQLRWQCTTLINLV